MAKKKSKTPFSLALLRANKKHHVIQRRIYGKSRNKKTGKFWSEHAERRYNEAVRYLKDINTAIDKLK